MTTKVSIVIPAYKRPKQLAEAVNSCIAQTLLPYEIIIGDDSPDSQAETEVERIRSHTDIAIKYVRNSPSLGQAGNVNMLFDSASGERVLLLHDDDMLLPNALEVLCNCFTNNPQISVAYGKQFIMTGDGTVSIKRSEGYNKSFYRTKEYEGSKLTSLEAGMVQQFPNNAYLIETALAKKVKYRDIGDACDFDFGLRVSQSGAKIHFTDTYTSKYRISEESVSMRSMNDAALKAYFMVKDIAVHGESLNLRNKWLQDRSGVAVGQAIANRKIKSAVMIFFSRYHFRKVFTPGGMKRFLLIMIHLCSIKVLYGFLLLLRTKPPFYYQRPQESVVEKKI